MNPTKRLPFRRAKPAIPGKHLLVVYATIEHFPKLLGPRALPPTLASAVQHWTSPGP